MRPAAAGQCSDALLLTACWSSFCGVPSCAGGCIFYFVKPTAGPYSPCYYDGGAE